LLLVEDEPRVRRALRLTLEDEGYQIVEAGTGDAGLAALRGNQIDVVLLDVMLPDTDGFSVCRAMRRTSDVPVIMVTARTDSHDVVAGLEAGADDYVTKPLVGKELSARIRALLRRAAPASARSNRLEYGDLVVAVDEGVVTMGGEPVNLTRTEFRLLADLALARGTLRSREQLLENVWGYDYFGDSRLVDAHVYRLRTKIEQDPSSPSILLTVRGLGYRLAS
jgi:DNA-binding response OmpR family regulator